MKTVIDGAQLIIGDEIIPIKPNSVKFKERGREPHRGSGEILDFPALKEATIEVHIDNQVASIDCSKLTKRYFQWTLGCYDDFLVV